MAPNLTEKGTSFNLSLHVPRSADVACFRVVCLLRYLNLCCSLQKSFSFCGTKPHTC